MTRQWPRSKAEAPERWKNKYETRLNPSEITNFKSALSKFTDSSFALAEKRSEDHMKWAVAERLVDAFDTYDNNSPGSGFAFTLQHAVCTTGMVGIDKSAKLVV